MGNAVLTSRWMFRTVRGRMLFWIIAVTLPIYAGALYMTWQATAQRLEAGAQRDVDQLGARLATAVDAVIRPIEGGVRTVAYQLEEIDPPPAQYAQRILGILKAWPDVYGSTIAVETANARGAAQPFAPYYFRRGEGFGFSDLATDKYAYQQLPWYRRPADTGQPVWSQPYFDAGGGDIWMVTYSVPFFRRQAEHRAVAGVVTADLDLAWVKRTAAGATLGPIGMGWLLSPSVGEPFVAPIGATTERVGRFDAAVTPDTIRNIGEGMLAANRSFALLPEGTTVRPAYLAVRSLETLGWQLMLVMPRDELLAEANALLRRQLWLGAIGLLLLTAAIYAVAAGVTRPIHALAVAVGRAREDELELQLPEAPRRDEIGVLTEALRHMGRSLREHVRLRAESLAETARLERDLQIAASIQQSMLPRLGVADLPAGIEVAAALQPARQVGGDLYDYLDLRDGHVLLTIGDVSDKGIPAALLMARLSSLLRVLGTAGEPPHRLLAAINSRLAEGNDACMFVTVGCALLDVNSGRLRYASAGHELPLVRNAEGAVRSLAAVGGPALGIEAVAGYELMEGFLAPGDTLLMYTDGVTEAQAQDESLFGLERLDRLLCEAPEGGAAMLVARIVAAVAEHAAGFHASDDLTVLAVRWNPAGVTFHRDGMHWRILCGADSVGIRQAQQYLQALLAAREVPQQCIGDALLISEELLTNIVRAAGERPAATRLALDVALLPEQIVLTVRDDGPAFDPLARADPSLEADIAERPIGGLGIYMVRQMAADCRYSRDEDWNVLQVRLDRSDSN